MKVIQAGHGVDALCVADACGRCGCCRLLLPLLTLNCHSWLGVLVQAGTQLNVSRGKEKPYADRLRDHIARVVDAAPSPTCKQRIRLADLLRAAPTR